RRGLRRTEPAGDRDRLGEPRSPARAPAPWRGVARDRVAAISRQPPVAPRVAELFGKLGMQRKAAPRQRVERRAGAPVERPEAAGLARRRAADLMPLDDDRVRAAPAREPGDRGADRAAAADDDAPVRRHGASVSGLAVRFQRRPRAYRAFGLDSVLAQE